MSKDTSITSVVLEKISEKVGSSETVQSIKFGRGVVGKIAVVAVIGSLAIGTASLKTSPRGALLAIGVIGLLCMSSLAVMLFIVHKQPELAVMEGMELVQWKQISVGAKDFTPDKPQLPVPDPTLGLGDGGEVESQ